MHVREVAATAAGHQDFLAYLVGAFQHNNLAAALACGDCAHEAGSACSDNDYVDIVHAVRIAALRELFRMIRGLRGPFLLELLVYAF